MGFNLVVWKWTPAYDSAAKRRKLGVKYEDVMAAFARDSGHAAMAKVDFEAFEADVVAKVGPEVVEGPYILERYACARLYDLPLSRVPALVIQLVGIARKHGLTSAEL